MRSFLGLLLAVSVLLGAAVTSYPDTTSTVVTAVNEFLLEQGAPYVLTEEISVLTYYLGVFSILVAVVFVLGLLIPRFAETQDAVRIKTRLDTLEALLENYEGDTLEAKIEGLMTSCMRLEMIQGLVGALNEGAIAKCIGGLQQNLAAANAGARSSDGFLTLANAVVNMEARLQRVTDLPKREEALRRGEAITQQLLKEIEALHLEVEEHVAKLKTKANPDVEALNGDAAKLAGDFEKVLGDLLQSGVTPIIVRVRRRAKEDAVKPTPDQPSKQQQSRAEPASSANESQTKAAASAAPPRDPTRGRD